MRKMINRLIVLVLLVGLMALPAKAVSVIPDVDESEEYAGAAYYLYEIGIFEGDERGYFKPDDPVTRAEMATIICRLLREDQNLTETSTKFSDVSTSYWASPYIAKAAALGIIEGRGNGKYGPTDTVLYEDALTMVVRALGLEPLALEAGGYPNGYIEVACEYGLNNWLAAEMGDFMDRWQIAMIIYNSMV